MNINEIKIFYKQQAEFAKQIEKAKANYADFLESAAKKHFYLKPEDFQSSYDEEIEEILLDRKCTQAKTEPREILEYMVFPKIRDQLCYLESTQSLTRVDRLKIELPDIDDDTISKLMKEAKFYDQNLKERV